MNGIKCLWRHSSHTKGLNTAWRHQSNTRRRVLARSMSAVAVEGSPVTETNRAEVTLKRFWKTVEVEPRPDGYAVTLDKRSLKTPSGNALLIPHQKRLLATLIANEWENQDKVLKAHALPVTSLASRAIDAFRDNATREEVVDDLLKYLDSDTVCFQETQPEALVRMQDQHWKPLLEWINSEHSVNVTIFESLFGSGHSEETRQKLKEVVLRMNEWEFAALERATYTTKSFVIALALIRGRLNAEQAAQAAHAEVNSQIEKWGEVEDSHDVDYHDIRRQLGSVACMVATT